MKQPLITVFVLNWNRRQYIDRVFQSIFNQSYKNIEILFVDNNSSDGSYEYVKEKYPNVLAYKLDKNYGCPYGRTLGVKWAKGEFVFYVDDDGVLEPDALMNAYSTISEDEKIGVVCGEVVEFDDEKDIDLHYKPGERGLNIISHFHGGISLHRVDMYLKTGVYPEYYFYGGEEGYLVMNMIKHGCYVKKDKHVVLWHEKKKQRNKVNELINRQKNGFTNKALFWPLGYFIIICFKVIFKHPFQAINQGVFFEWLKLWPKSMKESIVIAFKNRNPLTLKQFFCFTRYPFSNKEDMLKQQPYFVSIFSALKYVIFKA